MRKHKAEIREAQGTQDREDEVEEEKRKREKREIPRTGSFSLEYTMRKILKER